MSRFDAVLGSLLYGHEAAIGESVRMPLQRVVDRLRHAVIVRIVEHEIGAPGENRHRGFDVPDDTGSLVITIDEGEIEPRSRSSRGFGKRFGRRSLHDG